MQIKENCWLLIHEIKYTLLTKQENMTQFVPRMFDYIFRPYTKLIH